MITGQQMGEALMDLMPPASLVMNTVPDDDGIDREVRRVLSEAGLDVDAAYAIGNTIWMMAAQAQQEPEATVVGAFVTGMALVSILHKRGALA